MEGIRPDNTVLRYPMPPMPELTDEDTQALYAYLRKYREFTTWLLARLGPLSLRELIRGNHSTITMAAIPATATMGKALETCAVLPKTFQLTLVWKLSSDMLRPSGRARRCLHGTASLPIASTHP